MLVKVFALATLAVANCQEHQTYSLKTIITHDEPRKGDTHNFFQPAVQFLPIKELSATPVPTVTSGPPQHAKYNFDDINNYFIRPQPPPENPAPVYENVIDVTSPAPSRHVLVHQIAPQRIPVQHIQQLQPYSQVQHSIQVHHSPVQIQVPHIDLQPVHIPIQPIEIHQVPGHREDKQILHHEETQSHLGLSQGHNENSHEAYDDYYAIPKYSFEYKVEDPHTLDNKYHRESRDGDVVKGVYGLHEPDGSVRTVEYSSDKKTGFNAYVRNTGVTQHIERPHSQ